MHNPYRQIISLLPNLKEGHLPLSLFFLGLTLILIGSCGIIFLISLLFSFSNLCLFPQSRCFAYGMSSFFIIVILISSCISFYIYLRSPHRQHHDTLLVET